MDFSICLAGFTGRNKKRRKVEDIEDRLESLITRVGEKVNNYKLHCSFIEKK